MEIKLLTIKEYAKNKNITYEAVRKQIQKYKDDELKDHIIKKNKTQYLDEYAVDFLDNRRRESPVLLYQMEKDEQIEQLKKEKENLLLKLTFVQDELLKEKDEKHVLEVENAKIALLEADNEAARVKVAEAEENAQKALQELTEAHNQFEDELRRVNEAHVRELEAEKQRRISFKEFWQRLRSKG